jgi:hypothetical protein
VVLRLLLRGVLRHHRRRVPLLRHGVSAGALSFELTPSRPPSSLPPSSPPFLDAGLPPFHAPPQGCIRLMLVGKG